MDTKIKYISTNEVKSHNNSESTWLIIHNDVYDVTKFLNEHPGGEESILSVAGKDSTREFEDIGHSDDAREILRKYKIGTLPEGERGKKGCIFKIFAQVSIPLAALGVVALAGLVYYKMKA